MKHFLLFGSAVLTVLLLGGCRTVEISPDDSTMFVEIKPNRINDLDRSWEKPPQNFQLRDYLGMLYYYRHARPDVVEMEIVGRTPKGLPLHLLKFTDKTVPLENKHVLLITGFHCGAERTGTAGMLSFIDWLLSPDPLAVVSLRKNLILIMPNGNPEAAFLVEDMKNSRGADIYTLRGGADDDMQTLRPAVPADAPEVIAYQNVIDKYVPEIHLDVHGTGIRTNGELQPPLLDRAGSNSSLRSWDQDMIDFMQYHTAAKAGLGMIQMDVDYQRLVAFQGISPQMGGFCEMGSPYYTSAMYGYFKQHVLSTTLESTWCALVVEPLKGLLAYMNTHEPRVNTMKSICLRTLGDTPGARRASRSALWPKQRFFLVGNSYPETSNFAMTVIAYGEEGLKALTGSLGDSGRWGQVPLPELCQYLGQTNYVDIQELEHFLAAAPPNVKKVMFEKGDFEPGQDAVPVLDSGYEVVVVLPVDKVKLLYLTRNGKHLADSDYYVTIDKHFTEIHVKIPLELAVSEPVQLICCAWNDVQGLASDYGYRPQGQLQEYIDHQLSPEAQAEIQKCQDIVNSHRENPEKYHEK